MFVWSTQNSLRDGSSFMWHQPCNNRRSSEIQGTALGKCLQAWPVYLGPCLRFCWGYSEHVDKMTDTRKQKAEKALEMPIKRSLFAGNVQIG